MKILLGKLIVAIALAVACFRSAATPITAEQAMRAARNWVRGGYALDGRIGSEPDSVRSLSSSAGSSFHVVEMKDGGFVIMGSDTSVGPVVAFTSSGKFDSDPRNPLTALLKADLKARAQSMGMSPNKRLFASAAPGGATKSGTEAKWAALLADGGEADSAARSRMLLAASPGRKRVSDVRVDALVKSSWSQEDYRNYGYRGDSDICYNYYTPYHWPCGCVATAGAQIMRYHKHPKAPVEAAKYTCATGYIYKVEGRWYVSFLPVDLEMQGGTYDWENMPLVPQKGCTKVQRQAIGKLTSDLGIACGMQYYEDGGSAGVYMLTKRLVDRFGYANACGVTFDEHYPQGGFVYTFDRFKAAVVPSLDAGLPVALGIEGEYGHGVVGDGYGYSDGVFYVHVNFGWANLDNTDIWYAPPEFDEFTAINSIVYNIYPTGAEGLSLVSGRVYDQEGQPVPGAQVMAVASGRVQALTTADDRGIYALRVQQGQYTVSAVWGTKAASASVTVGACVSTHYMDDGYYGYDVRPSIGNVPDFDLALETVETPEYVIRLDPNGGSVDPDLITVQVGRPFGSLPTPTLAGHACVGWESATYGLVTSETLVPPAGDNVLVAKWRPNSYVVRFDADGGDGSMDDQRFVCGVSQALPLNAFAKDGLYFAGWALKAGGEVAYLDGETVGDLASEDGAVVELHAVWSESRQTVRVAYDAAGGTFPNGESVRMQTMAFGRYYQVGDRDFPVRPVRAGYVFNGWWDKSTEPPSYVGGSGEGPMGGLSVDEDLASDLTAGWDDPYVICERTAEGTKNVEIEPLRISVAGFSTPKITAKGLPSGLSIVGDSLVGTPKKSGVYVVTFTATSDERKNFKAIGSSVFVVREYKSSELAAYACCDGAAGKVTGGKICAVGKPVTLKAAANKGYVFDRWGWYDEAGEAVVSGHDREPSLKFTMPAAGDVWLEAEFVTVQEVSDSVCAWTDNGDFGGEEGGDSVTLLQGVYREWHLDADAMHPVGSIKVTGLPSGLKFTAKAIVDKKTGVTNVPPNTIYGYPSAVSKKAKNATAYTPSAVTVSVTTDSKVTRKITWRMTVLPLPEWAVGTFSGHLHHEAEGGTTERSAASLTVGKTGKVSGKFNTYDSVAKKVLKWTFSADGFVESDFGGVDGDSVGSVRIRAAGKSGKLAEDVELVIDRTIDARELLLATACATGKVSECELELWRNIWKDKGAAMTEFAKTYSLLQGTYNIVLAFEDEGCNLQSGYLTLKVDAKGGAKAAGKLPDGSSTSFSPMLSYQDGEFAAMSVVEPSAYKGGFASVVLRFDGKRIGGRGDWLNRSPTTCDVYGMPEGGDFTVRGSLYDKTVKLSSWFNELFVFSDIPRLEYTYKEKTSAGTETNPDMFASPSNVVQTALAVDAKDKLKAVASAGKPVAVDKANGIWNYDAPNVESVTVSFTPSTGVFKGSYVGWYDYVSAVDTVKDKTTWSHASKKYSFEGIWVQDPSGETAGELTGFIMFDRTGRQTDAKTGKQKSYKYKVNRSMGLGLRQDL